jgi:hypothetical protein
LQVLTSIQTDQTNQTIFSNQTETIALNNATTSYPNQITQVNQNTTLINQTNSSSSSSAEPVLTTTHSLLTSMLPQNYTTTTFETTMSNNATQVSDAENKKYTYKEYLILAAVILVPSIISFFCGYCCFRFCSKNKVRQDKDSYDMEEY